MSRQKPKKFWEKHIEAFHKTKMSQRKYCLANGLTPRALQYHIKKLRNESGNPGGLQKCQTEWLPMSVIDEPTPVRCSGSIRIQLSRITIEAEQGCDGVHLAQMLRSAGMVC